VHPWDAVALIALVTQHPRYLAIGTTPEASVAV